MSEQLYALCKAILVSLIEVLSLLTMPSDIKCFEEYLMHVILILIYDSIVLQCLWDFQHSVIE